MQNGTEAMPEIFSRTATTNSSPDTRETQGGTRAAFTEAQFQEAFTAIFAFLARLELNG